MGAKQTVEGLEKLKTIIRETEVGDPALTSGIAALKAKGLADNISADPRTGDVVWFLTKKGVKMALDLDIL